MADMYSMLCDKFQQADKVLKQSKLDRERVAELKRRIEELERDFGG